MALKTIVESLDDLPEPVASEYTERDLPGLGKRYVLDLEGVNDHPEVKNLKSAFEKVKRDKTDLTGKLTAAEARLEGLPEDFDPEELARLRAEAEERAKNPDDHKKQQDAVLASQRQAYEQRIEAVERKYKKIVDDKDAAINERDRELEKLLIEDGLSKALAAAGVSKELMDGARALHRASAKVLRDEETGERRAVIAGDMGEVPIEEHVTNWAQSEGGKVYVKPAAGGGAAGGAPPRFNGKNPWDKKTPGSWNLTKQQEMITQAPEKARQMARAAEQPVTW